MKRGTKRGIQTAVLLAGLAIVVIPTLRQQHRIQRMEEAKQTLLSNTQTDKAEEGLSVQNPRVNYVTNPIGIDTNEIFFSWELLAEEAENAETAWTGAFAIAQSAYEIEVYETKNHTLVWDSGFVEAKTTTNVAYEGDALADHTDYEYCIYVYDTNGNCSASEKASFQTAFVNGEPMENAKLISMQEQESIYEGGQAIYFHTFQSADKELAKATFYGSALGIYHAYINGERIGEDELTPGWTDYEDTLLYNTYDITERIERGADNTIASMLGTGWWCGRNGFGTYGYHQPAFLCQLRLEYKDGTTQIINTDESWRYLKDTAVQAADLFNGETYDASKPTAQEVSASEARSRKERNRWIAESREVAVSQDFTGSLHSFYGYNVQHIEQLDQTPTAYRIYEGTRENGSTYGEVATVWEWEQTAESKTADTEKHSLEPITIAEGQTLLVDLGQNMSGVPYLEYEAPKGCEITIQVAEMCNDTGEQKRGNDGAAGSLYRANYRSAQTLVSILAAGGGKETYQPSFFYSGFRYLALTASRTMTIYTIKGCCIGNTSPQAGSLVTDNEKLNQLISNITWSQRSNYMLTATDCPQRDERLGWLGDLCSFAQTSLYNQDLYSFYEKWARDLLDAQTQEGAYTDTVPSVVTTGSGNGGWADAGIFVPLAVYAHYGSKQQLTRQYASMQAYMKYVETSSSFEAEKRRMGPNTAYGDWLAQEHTDAAFLSALWYGADALAMQKVADILGEKKDAKEYQRLHGKIKTYVQEVYLPAGEDSLRECSQTELLFLLKYDMLLENQLAAARKQLEESIVQNDCKLMTGFAGTPILLEVLTEHDMTPLAYQVLLKEENPSWLYGVKQGATTIWEHFGSYTQEEGFLDADMNSFNHFNEGSVGQWLYEAMLGITVDCSQEIPIRICPQLPPEGTALHAVSGSYHSVWGEIAVSWENGGQMIRIQIPAGAEAKVILPFEGSKELELSGGNYIFEREEETASF